MRNDSNTYEIRVRQTADADTSEEKLRARYRAKSYNLNGISQSLDLGNLPKIFGKFHKKLKVSTTSTTTSCSGPPILRSIDVRT